MGERVRRFRVRWALAAVIVAGGAAIAVISIGSGDDDGFERFCAEVPAVQMSLGATASPDELVAALDTLYEVAPEELREPIDSYRQATAAVQAHSAGLNPKGPVRLADAQRVGAQLEAGHGAGRRALERAVADECQALDAAPHDMEQGNEETDR